MQKLGVNTQGLLSAFKTAWSNLLRHLPGMRDIQVSGTLLTCEDIASSVAPASSELTFDAKLSRIARALEAEDGSFTPREFTEAELPPFIREGLRAAEARSIAAENDPILILEKQRGVLSLDVAPFRSSQKALKFEEAMRPNQVISIEELRRALEKRPAA